MDTQNSKCPKDIHSNHIIRCLAVGDGFVGKTSLLSVLANRNCVVDNYVPTVFDNYSILIEYSDKKYELHLVDIAGQQEYEDLRIQFYSNAQIVLLCFSVISIDTFVNIKEKWIPEVKRYAPNAAIIIIGTKSDLRIDPETIDRMRISDEFCVNRLLAEKFATLNDSVYVECSAKTKENLDNVIDVVINTYLSQTTFLTTMNRCCLKSLHCLIANLCCRNR